MPTRYDTPVGKRVTELLARAGLIQADLADRLGISRTALNQMLTGRRPAWPDLERKAEDVLVVESQKENAGDA